LGRADASRRGDGESYYGRIDDMPEDALRFFPSRGVGGKGGDTGGEGDDVVASGGGGGGDIGNNETLAAVVARLKAEIKNDEDDDDDDDEMEVEVDDGVDYGNHNLRWDDGPSSWDEFGHDNDPDVCRMRTMTVAEWESGRHWRNDVPVMVTNVTAGWAANVNWELEEMLRRYPDAEATMGDGRRVGEIGPDAAGRLLDPTTVKVGGSYIFVLLFSSSIFLSVRPKYQLDYSPTPRQLKEFITKHMYNPFKYFFDRKIAIPKGMLEDCRPFPLPTRKFLDDPLTGTIRAPSKKGRVHLKHERERWRDHLAIAIGSDLQGLTFHHHGSAWNTVIFGKKRWIIYQEDEEVPDMVRRMALENIEDSWRDIPPTPDWIRRLYPDPWRTNVVRSRGMDCIQHAGTMMFVPRGWMHMVVNIGDTVSVISEQGLDKGEGKRPEDFLDDPPHPSSDWREENESSDDSDDDVPPPRRRDRRENLYSNDNDHGPPPSEDDSSDDSEDSEDEWGSEDIKY
jgi:hypothetical protein